MGTLPLKGVEGVDFGDVSYLRRKSRGITIANTSRVSATFSFVKRPTEPGETELIAPKWLRLTSVPPNADAEYERTEDIETDITLEPGDAVNVTVQVFVDDIDYVRGLNEGTAELDDVLVLRVTDGRDHFIPVRGTWQQSCFGRTIDELIRIPVGGVRALVPRRHADGPPINRGQDVCWSAPRELFKLTETVEILTERAIADKDMIDSASFPMNSTGWPFDQSSWVMTDTKVRELRRSYVLEALDSDKNLIESFPPEVTAMERLEIVAEVLLLFLGGLHDGIITTTLWDKLEQDMTLRKQAMSTEEERTWVLDVLSTAPNHNISLVFLTSMLSKIAGELAPVPRSTSASAKSSFDLARRSLSIRAKKSPAVQDPAVTTRKALDRRWAEIFAGVVIRGSTPSRDKERRAADDRKRHILEVFIQGDMEN